MSKQERVLKVSVDEYVASLKHSRIPTVVVEGGDDIVVYRYIEQRFGPLKVSVLPVGGRDAVLAIYLRLAEIGNHVFTIADSDCWCMMDVPSAFKAGSIIFTYGYSIENDIILDGKLTDLMTQAEASRFQEELHRFLEWYVLAINRYISQGGEVISIHPNAVLDNEAKRKELIRLCEQEEYPDDLRTQISLDPLRLIRGKSLLALLMRQLSYSGRSPRHHHLALMETTALKPGPHLSRIFEEVREYFDIQ